MENQIEETGVAIVRRELKVLTGNFMSAMVLNQFIYWSQRIKYVDKYIAEERERAAKGGETIVMPLAQGWFYKSSEELNEELMWDAKPATVRSYIKKLVAQGYVEERNNPDRKWDRTKQYRVNLVKVITDLNKLGYNLPQYKNLLMPTDTSFSKIENATTPKPTDAFSKIENGISKSENAKSEIENRTSPNFCAIPEISTEITNKDYNNNVDSKDVVVVESELCSQLLNNEAKETTLNFTQSVSNPPPLRKTDPSLQEESDIGEADISLVEQICQQNEILMPIWEDKPYIAEMIATANGSIQRLVDALAASVQFSRTNEVSNLKGLIKKAIENKKTPSPEVLTNPGRKKCVVTKTAHPPANGTPPLPAGEDKFSLLHWGNF